MKNLKTILRVVVLLGLLACAWVSYSIYLIVFAPNTRFDKQETYVYIPTGTQFPELLEILNPVLKNSGSFTQLAERKQYRGNVKPGRYVIERDMSNNDIINVLRSNNTPFRLAFNNQETIEHLSGRIGALIEADSLELLSAFTDPDFLDENGLDEANVLSLCIPNTYEFYWNTGAEEFRDRMKAEHDRFWNSERRSKAQTRQLSPAEVYSLASIVQKETVQPDERPRVAGVYLNRLRKGMLLQADPTVVYALKKQTGNFDTIVRRVLIRDLKIDSPYNTYKYGGVPPGPISMPDISSIEAVLNPESHEFLYFVADPSRPGYHLFARNLSEHNRNKVVYIKWLDDQNIRR